MAVGAGCAKRREKAGWHQSRAAQLGAWRLAAAAGWRPAIVYIAVWLCEEK